MPVMRSFRRWRTKWSSQRDWSLRDNLGREALTGIRGQLYVDRGGDHTDTVYLAGTARSGTSWISEVLNHDNTYRMIHEPLRRDRLKVTQVFRPRHYLRPEDDSPRHVAAMRAIVSGDIRSIWTDKYNHKLLPRRRLIREVRGMILLPWIHAHFREMPTILLLRHPCAVAASQLKWGQEWPVDLNRFLAEPDLMANVLEPFRHELERVAGSGSEFERHVFGWCIENYVPLRDLEPGDVHVAFYESFCITPDAELGGLFAFLGREVDDEALTKLGRPSNSTRKDSAIVRGESLVEGWRTEVSSDDVARAVDLLALFGLDRIYGADPMPRVTDPGAALALPWPAARS
jgi:hypothetical protein